MHLTGQDQKTLISAFDYYYQYIISGGETRQKISCIKFLLVDIKFYFTFGELDLCWKVVKFRNIMHMVACQTTLKDTIK